MCLKRPLFLSAVRKIIFVGHSVQLTGSFRVKSDKVVAAAFCSSLVSEMPYLKSRDWEFISWQVLSLTKLWKMEDKHVFCMSKSLKACTACNFSLYETLNLEKSAKFLNKTDIEDTTNPHFCISMIPITFFCKYNLFSILYQYLKGLPPMYLKILRARHGSIFRSFS